MKDKYQQTLYDFDATIAAHPEYNDSTLLEKFPEFGGDANKLKAAFDYSATLQSGKYADDIDRLNAMFPEFFGQTDSVEVNNAEKLPATYVLDPDSTSVNTSAPPQSTQFEKASTSTPLNSAQIQKGFWKTAIGDVIEKFGAGVLNTVGGLGVAGDKLMETPVGKALFPGVAIGNAINNYANIPQIKPDKVLNYAQSLSERGDFHGMIEDEETGQFRKKQYSDLWKEKKPLAALGEIMLSATESAPTSLVAMLPGGLVLVSASAAGQKYQELETNPETADMPEWKKWLNASVSGAIEGATEKVGAKIDKLAFEPFLEKMTEETVKGILRKGGVNALIQTVTEGIEESLGQMGENIVDYATGVNDTYSPFEGVGDAFVYGAGGGAQFGAATFSMSGYRAYQQRAYEQGGAKVVEDMKTKVINDIINPPLIEDIDINNPAFPASSKLQLLKAKEAMDNALAEHEFTFDYNMADLTEEQQKQVVEDVLSSEDLSDEQKQAIANYMTTANVERQIQDMQEQAYQNELEADIEKIRSSTNQDTGTYVLADLKGVVDSEGNPIPVTILRGLVFNEDGEIDIENSSDIIYYKEGLDGETKTTSIEHIDDAFSAAVDERIASAQQISTEMQQLRQRVIDQMISEWLAQEQIDEMNPDGPVDTESETVEDNQQSAVVPDPEIESTITEEQQVPELTPEQQAELEAEQKKQEFLNTLPVHEKGANVGEIDQSRMTAEQNIQYFEYTYGPERTLGAAQAQVRNLQSSLKKEQAKLDKNPFDISQNEKIASLETDLKHYNDYVNSVIYKEHDKRLQEGNSSLVDAARKQEEEKARKQEEARQAQLEAESLQGVPDMMTDTAEAARNRGFRSRNGVKIDRAQPIEVVKSSNRTRKFKDGHEVEVKRTIVEADQLHPSHKAGAVNPMHFITEGQPKNRTDDASKMARESIATKINPEEITGGVTAYTGAPVANSRGEVIQGNGRTDGLQAMYKGHPESAAKYKQYLADTASEYGMTADEVMAMNNPVAVDITNTDDSRSVELGQFTATDTESGGVQRISPQHTAVGLGDNMANFSSILFNTQNEDMSMSEVIEMNGKKALEYLYNKGLLNDTQYQSAFDANGNLTPEVKTDLQNVSAHMLFHKAGDNMQQMFATLPDKARKSILQTVHRDLDSADADRLMPEIRDAIEAYYHLQQHPEFSALTKYEDLRIFAEQVRNQKQMFNSETELPLQKYSNFAIELALLFKTDRQNALRQRFNSLYDNLQGKGGDMFSEAVKLPLVGAIKRNFNNIDYVPNNKQIQRTSMGADNTERTVRQQTGTISTESGEQSESGERISDSGGGTIGTAQPVSSRTERIGELTAAFDNATTLQEKGDIARQLNTEYEKLFNSSKNVEIHDTTESFVEAFNSAVDSRYTPEQAQAYKDGLIASLEAGEMILGVEIGGRIFINVEHNTNSGEFTKTWLHEETHLADSKIFTAEDKTNANIPNIDNHIPRVYWNYNSRVKFSEAIAHAVEGLLDSHTIEQIAQGEADLSGVHEDIREIVLTTLKQLTNGTSENIISGRHNENAHDGTQGSSTEVRTESESGHDGTPTNATDTGNQTRTESSGKERQPGESIADYANRVVLNNQLADAGKKVDPNPSEAQKQAGNYKKGHVKVNGLDITIENPAGSERSGTDENGNPWSIKMNNHYGYFKLTKAIDGDHVDVFIGNNPSSEKVYVVDQINPDTKQFDENKVMLGFDSMDQAQEAYLSNYEEGWQGMGAVTEVDINKFKDWLYRGTKQQKPFSEYKIAESQIQGLDYTAEEVKDLAAEYITELIEETELDIEIVGIEIVGSRMAGNATETSDLDMVVQYKGDISESGFFNILNSDPLEVDGVRLDLNPIKAEKSGTLEEYLKKSKAYQEEKSKERKSNESIADYAQRLHNQNVRYRKTESELRFRKEAKQIKEVKNGLVVLHNMSENNFLTTAKNGRMPMPSIAITKPDISFTGYGDITLIGKKGLIDPQADKRNKVYSADAYTTRYPNVIYEVKNDKALINYTKDLPKEFTGAGYDITSSIKDGGLDRLKQSRYVQYMFLKEQGVDITVNKEAPQSKEVIDVVRSIGAYDWYHVENKEAVRKTLSSIFLSELDDEKRNNEFLMNRLYLSEDGLVNEHFIKDMYNTSSQYIRETDRGDLVDEYKTLNEARERVVDHNSDTGYVKGYPEYVGILYDNLDVESKIFDGYTPSGRRRDVENTPENALKIMLKDKGRGKEGAGGFGQAVALQSRQFKTTTAIKNDQERLTDHDKYKEAKDRVQEKYTEFADAIRDNYKYTGWGYLEAIASELSSLARNGQSDSFSKISKEAQGKAKDLLQTLKTIPVMYFEAKPERIVYMNEFAGAVIPFDISQEVKEALDRAGINYREYSDADSRIDAVKQISKDMDLRFRISNAEMSEIKTQAIADGTFMTAPNGKPTNLTEHQWLQTRTLEFREWFGDWQSNPDEASKVVDENGEPMVVYHGGPKFNVFDNQKINPKDRGFYFTDNLYTAIDVYALNSELKERDRDNYDYDGLPDEMLESAEWDEKYFKHAEVKRVFLNIKNPVNADGYHASVLRRINTESADGIIAKNALDIGADGGQYVVLNPNQIKSATSNIGTFDSDNNDIRYRILGEKGAEALDAFELATKRMDGLQLARHLDSNMPQADEKKLKIRQATGWEKGADGKWRYEVSNETIKYPDNVEGATLADVLNKDSEILRAYPKLKDMPIVFLHDKADHYSGSFNREEGIIEINHPSNQLIADYSESIKATEGLIESYNSQDGITMAELNTGRKGEEARNQAIKVAKESISRSQEQIERQKQIVLNERGETIIHEVQHAIQGIEGFERGGNLESKNIFNREIESTPELLEIEEAIENNETVKRWRNRDKNLPIDEVKKLRGEIDNDAELLELKRRRDEILGKRSDLNIMAFYNNLAGETEARNSARRMNMTQEEMRNTLLESTEDVAREDQIMMREGLSVLEGMYQEDTSGIRFRKDEGAFYSTVEKALDGIAQEKGTKEQFRAMLLKGGAKQAEMTWMNFDALPGKLTKADIQNWINENRINIEEVAKGKTEWEQTGKDKWERKLDNQKTSGRNPKDGKATISYNNHDNKYYGTTNLTNFQHSFNSLDAAKMYYDNIDGLSGDTRYHQYVLPGGKNYKELLLTIPSIDQAWKNIDDFKQSMRDKYGNGWRSKMSASENSTFEYLVGGESKMPQHDFESSHFGERNILAHIRFNERTTEDGQKVLFIEEVQSDWAQEARKSGQKGEGKVPDMPFKNTDQWVNLAMRRAMKYAADNGFDRIAWTTGEHQVKRYSMTDMISDLWYYPTTKELGWQPMDGTSPERIQSVEESRIADYVGEQLSKKLLAQEANSYGVKMISGDGLEVGGEGMKSFYNKMLPAQANKIGKSFKSRASAIDLGGEVGKVLSMPVTNEMIEGTREGAPLFRKHNKELEAIKEKAIADGTFMTAPNGNPTNLNERQWLQTQTPEFKEWFGESKVIDDNGEPMVVYHGTGADFDVFDSKVFPTAGYFSKTPDIANGVANDKYLYHGENASVYPVWLSMVSPIDLLPINGQQRFTPSELSDALPISLPESVIKELEKEYKHPSPIWSYLGSKVIIDYLKRNNYDGVLYKEGEVDHELNQYLDTPIYNTEAYIAFESNQIKSAIANIGTFDIQNEDIRYRILGEKGAEALDRYDNATIRADNLRVAWRMEEAGKDALEIKQATGWERGREGRWRYEIPGENVSYPESGEGHLIDVLDKSSAILKAYPEIGDISIYFTTDEGQYKGAYFPSYDMITINHPLVDRLLYLEERLEDRKKMAEKFATPSRRILSNINIMGGTLKEYQQSISKEIQDAEVEMAKIKETILKERRGTLFHEIQHAIQRIEDFSIGGNEESFQLAQKKIDRIEKETSRDFDRYESIIRQDAEKAGKMADLEKAMKTMKSNKDMYDYVKSQDYFSNDVKSMTMHLESVEAQVGRLREADSLTPFDFYKRIAGEIEARNADIRSNYTTEQISNSLLQDTEDISREDQIVIREGLGLMLDILKTEMPLKPSYRGQSLSEYAQKMADYNEEVRFRITPPDIPTPPVLHAGMNWKQMSDAISLFKGNTAQVFQDINKEMNKIHLIYTEFIDRAKPLEKILQEMAKKGAKLSPSTNAYVDYMTSSSKATRLTQVYNKTRIEPLQKLLRAIVDRGDLDGLPMYRWEIIDRTTGEIANNKPITRFERIGLYLQAKDILEAKQMDDGLDRGEKGFSENVRNEFGASVGPSQYVDAFEAAVGMNDVNDIWTKVRAVNQFALDLQLEYGLITQEIYDEYTNGRKFYVPQRGWRERDLNDRDYHYINDISGTPDNPYNSALVKAKGRTSLAGDPLAYMQSIGESSIASAMKNQTKQKFLEFAEENADFARTYDWFGFKKVYYVATGTRDADGNMTYERTFEPPTQDQLDQDSKVNDKLKDLWSEMDDLYNAYSSGQKTPKQYDAGMKKLRATEKQLQNLIQVKFTDSEASRIAQVTAKERGQHTVVTLKEGKEYEITFSEHYSGERVANILNRNFGGKMNTELDLEGLVKANISIATRTMSALMTQYNPSFAATNAVRDWGTALISNLSEFGLEYTLNTQKNLVNPKMQAAVWQYVASDQFGDGDGFSETYHGQMLKEFFEDGSATGWSFLKDIDQLRTDMRKAIDPTTMNKVLDGTFGLKNAFGLKQVFGVLTEVSELNTRFAQYLTSREAKNADGAPAYTREEAAMHAKEVSVNFDRRGNNRFFSSMFSFFNAQLQGTNKMYRMVKDPKVRKGLITITSAMLVGGILQAMLQPDPDDEDDRAFTEWEQMTNFCFGKVKIPLPQGFRAFWGIGTQIGMAAKRQKGVAESLIDGTDFFLGELLPEQFVWWMNGFEIDERNGNLTYNAKLAARGAIPTSGQPAYDVIANTNFMGGTSYRTEFTNKLHDTKAERTLGKYNVSEGAQWISDQLFKIGGGDLEDSSKLKKDQVGTVQGMWDLNPSAIETLFSGYGGGTGKFVIDMITLAKQVADPEKDVDISRMQVFNTFWKQPREYGAFENEVRVLQKRTDYYKTQYGQIRKDNPDAYKELIKMNVGDNAKLKKRNPDAWERLLDEEGTKANKMFNLTKESEILLKQIEIGNVDKRQIKEQVEYLNEQYEKLR